VGLVEIGGGLDAGRGLPRLLLHGRDGKLLVLFP